jgi:outer membrane receptor protein involved in Fe transport
MTYFKTIVVFITLFITSLTFAQDMKVEGTVYDTTGTKPLKNAVAVAIRVKDSLMLGFARTDSEGKFQIKEFPLDTFSLIISHPSFDDKTYYVFGHENNYEILIPKITMPSKAQELEEVIIYANKNPIFYNGDTLVYVADSFQVAEHAVVEDLLKKLPGLEIDKDGKIKSQGKEIDQVLVDGDEFFGSDPTIATKNLGAKGVETVQVYEKKQENAADGEETLQVLDLRLKDEAKKGYFGRVSGATDFAQFYEGELLLNNFNKTQKISVFVLAANTPKSEFGFGDINKFGLDNEGGRTVFSDDGDITYYNNGSQVGIPQTLKAGIYFSDKFGKKKGTEIGFNYSYYNSKNNALSQSRSQYFIQDSTYFSDDSTRYISENESHNFNLRFKSKLDSLTTLEIRPSLRINQGIQNNLDYSTWRDADNLFSRSNNVTNTNDAKEISFDNQLRFNRNFMKPRRQLSINYDIEMSDNKANGLLNSTNVFSDTSVTTIGFDQEKINNKSSIDNSVRMSYFEPIGKKFKIQAEYTFDLGNSDQIKETRDFNAATGQYDLVNNTFSNTFDNVRTQHRAGAQLWYETKKITMHGGLRIRNINIDNTNRVTDTLIHQNFTNYLPIFNLRFNPTRSTRFSFSYNTNSRQPSISDLVPVPDNTNPNRIRTGNPNLRPDYSHQANLNFNTWNALSGRYIYAGAWGNVTQNAFGDSTIINAIGQQISQRVNVKNASNVSFWMGAGIPLFSRKIIIQPNISGGVSEYTSYLNSQENIATNLRFGPSLEVRYETDSLELEVSYSIDYNQPKNTLSTFNTVAYTTQDYFFGATWRLKYGFKIQANTNYTINGQRAVGYNLNYFIVNAALSKTFLKTRNLELSLLANDILNQNISNSRDVNQNVVTDNNTKIISRYFLLKLTYRFNNNKTTEEDGHGRWH